ncbi:MAG TPA: ferrous iron transporter B [Terriglobales bacterium]|nr:ferrous iron transporter B [Terriglobales bacterium]
MTTLTAIAPESRLKSDVPTPKTIQTLALVGPPNSGKSTLFNNLTGLRQKVANFPGVTVEHRAGRMRGGRGEGVTVLDLPGIHSLSPHSEDERVAADVLYGRMPGTSRPDAIILILDATNLNRHLVLAARVITLGLPTLVLLNMADALRQQNGSVDLVALAGQLGTPVALICAARGEGLATVQKFVSSVGVLPAPVELPVLQDVRHCREWAVRVASHASYRRPLPPAWSQRLDSIFLHRHWGPAIFLAVVIAAFQLIFRLGQPLSNGLQDLLLAAGQPLGAHIPAGLMRSLLMDGAWKGMTSVLVFLPQILLLFLLIGVLEDSGYLARAAVITDRTMAKLGLNGKAFIPLLSAYACAVPAIMATRTIENRRDRMATILIAPLMTCSARLPVYTMIIAAFVPDRPLAGIFLGTRAAAMLGLYVVGFLAAVVTARLLKSSVLKSHSSPFMMELPTYRWPTARSLGLRLADRSWAFASRVGTVVLAVSLALALLINLPVHSGQAALQDSVLAAIGQRIEPVIAPLGFNWKIGVGLLTSIAAREVIVGTLGTLYGMDPGTHAMSLQGALHADLSPGAAVALLLFFAFALQCTSTLAVVRKETNSWRWPLAQFLYMAALAYGSALLANQLIQHLRF